MGHKDLQLSVVLGNSKWNLYQLQLPVYNDEYLGPADVIPRG